MRRGGLTFVELLICIGIIILLAGLAIPSLGQARKQATAVVCGSNLRRVGVALGLYQSSANRQFPPFAFSSYRTSDLPLSGHWGGISQPADPDGSFRLGVKNINLWALVCQEMLTSASLICPGSAAGLEENTPGYFSYSRNFSTYCLRFPVSADLFRSSPNLLSRSRSILDTYAQAAGGQLIRTGGIYEQVPLLRADRVYRTLDAAACGDGDYTPAVDAVASDMFWRQDYNSNIASPRAGLIAYPVKWQWNHGSQFNVLYGGGGVGPRNDRQGIIAANSNSPGSELPSDGLYFATYSEKVWQFFDSQR